MGLKATFDTDNLLILLDQVAPVSSKVEIDTQVDLYSDAKEDWASVAAFMNFEFPFTTVGGDEIGAGREVGDYYFLRTDLGWRIRPYEADHELTITGNLYPYTPGDTMIVPTSSAATVAVLLERSQLTQTVQTGVGSATVDNAAVASAVWGTSIPASAVVGTYGEAVRGLTFGERVYFDPLLGSAGTTYPIGTQRYPSNDLNSVFTIAARESAPIVHMEGEGILHSTDSADGFIIEGHHPLKVQLQVSAGASTVNTQFRELQLRNAYLGGWVVVRDSVMQNVYDFQGIAHQCMLMDTVAVTGANSSQFLHCYTGPGGFTLDMANKNVDVIIAGHIGDLTIINNDKANTIEVGMLGGNITVASTCTAGVVTCQGIGAVVDESLGATVVDELVAGGGSLSATQDTRLRELHQIFGLEAGSPLITTVSTRSAASVTQTITGDPETAITITRV